MDYGGWGPFLGGFLLAGALALLPITVLTGLWLRAAARQMFSRLEELLEDETDER